MTTAEKWLADIPCQFREGHNINAIIKVFSKHIDDVEQMLYDIRDKTTLDTATGQNLDYLGSIIKVTRQEAFSLLRQEAIGSMTDDIYRSVLKFQEIKNNTDATYDDVMRGIYLLWGERSDIHYIEDKSNPARMTINMDDILLDDVDPVSSRPLVIHGGGVDVVFNTNYLQDFDLSSWERFTNGKVSYVRNYYFDGEKTFDGSIEFQSEELEEDM